MSCCGDRNFLALPCKNFDRSHSLLLASSATGSARKRPHFDTSPFALLIYTIYCLLSIKITALTFVRAVKCILEQTGDPAVFVNIDLFSSGSLGQTGHGHNVAGKSNDEARTGGNLQIANGNGEIFGSAQQALVIRE